MNRVYFDRPIIVKYGQYHYIIDQRRISFNKKAQNCDNSVVYYTATLNLCISKLVSKYSLDNSLNVSCNVLKEQM